MDLLPRNPAISYHYDNVLNGPHHVSSPELHPKYDYSKFIGGIMLMTCEQFQKVRMILLHDMIYRLIKGTRHLW